MRKLILLQLLRVGLVFAIIAAVASVMAT